MQSDSMDNGDVLSLLRLMSGVVYKPIDRDTYLSIAMETCLEYFGKDYVFTTVNNDNGELCGSYPRKIVLAECDRNHPNGECNGYTDDRDGNDSSSLPPRLHGCRTVQILDLFEQARLARCRTRFVVPVIFLDGKHICRSATISGGTEIYGRSYLDLFYTGGQSIPGESGVQQTNGNWPLVDRARAQDIKLLKKFKVKYICDLMVENKKVKYYMNVTSSEKIDKEQRYADFGVLSMPYPGCEFFRIWRDKSYCGEQSFYDWDQDYVTTTLNIPKECASKLPVDWKNYKSWDIITLTQNYLKLLLLMFREGDSSILVHCVSGWDRTPLFLSLIRISLWADGLVHRSLSAKEMLYLTLAYDWFMFGHDLPDRLAKGEEIMFFAFYFLKYMQDKDIIATPKQYGTAPKHVQRTRTASSKADAEWIDSSILLESEPIDRCGSCTSLCSNSSVSSNRSADCPQRASTSGSDDAPPILCVPSSGHSDDVATTCPPSTAAADLVAPSPIRGSTPVPVPARAQSGSPSIAGSWQIVNGYGSPSEPCKSSSSGTTGSLLDVPEPMPEPCTTRRTRLAEVQQLFYEAYEQVIGIGSNNDKNAAGGRISALLGYIATKVGAKK